MFELHNPISSRDVTKSGGFQSLTLSNQSAQISNATNRQVEFALSDDVELLEVRVGWSDSDNSRGLDQIAFWSQCFDVNGRMIPNSHRPMVIPFVAGFSKRFYFIPILTPSNAKKIIFTCNYIDIQVCIVSRTAFKEPQS
ncbi:hypothetical protein HJA60_004285 [Vibrio vulnificus]|nr:hypothetical protein [Vibrio vulnificus]